MSWVGVNVVPGGDEVVPRRSIRVCQAALLLTAACAVNGPLRFVLALPLVILSLAVAIRAWLAPDSDDSSDRSGVPSALWMMLAGTAALGFVTDSTGGPLWFEALRYMWAVAGVLIAGVASSNDARWRRRAVAAAVASASALYLLTPFATPHPIIDVVPWTSTAVNALLGGVHPYTVIAPDVYDGGRDFGFDVRAYPYMPATLLVFAPFTAAFGDFRIALAVALPVTIWLLRRAAVRAAVPPQMADFVTLAVALNPIGVGVVRSGWSEPLMTVLAAAFALGVCSRGDGLATSSLVLLPMLKQYALAPPLLWAIAPRRARTTRPWIVACTLAAATVLPFLAWNFHATLAGVLFQMRAPAHPRLTAISLPGLLFSKALPYPAIWASAAAEIAVCAAIAVRRRALDPPNVLIGSAIALTIAFLAGWQAFVNYYAFVASLLLIAALLGAAPGDGR